MSKRRKFYKYTLVPLFSLVLLFILLGKSVEAATGTSFTFPTGYGVGTYSFYVDGFSSGPEDISQVQLLDGATSLAPTWYSFKGHSNIYIRFDTTAGSDSNYKGGYLNGTLTCTVNYPITTTGTPAPTNTKRNYAFQGVQTESVSCSMISWSNNAVQFVVTLNNYSLNPDGGSLREIYLGVLDIDYYFNVATTDTVYSISCTPTTNSHNGGFKCTPVAQAGVSIAGQLYAAIENSTSISDIVAYLSAIEDASGDINVAISHINETLLPNVITYLQSLIANTNLTNTKLNTLINYLNVISSTWPDYSAQVLFYLSQLVNMNEEQSSLAAEVESQYQAKASEGAELNQGMQVVIPTVNQDSFNINANVDSGTVTTLSAFWALFPANALIGTLFAIAIAGIAAGFFLYGKKR